MKHVGGPNSYPNQAWGLAFCFEDEFQDPFDRDIFQDSSNQGVFQEKFQGHFLELLRFLADHNGNIKALSLKNSPEKLKLTSPEIQKVEQQMIVIIC